MEQQQTEPNEGKPEAAVDQLGLIDCQQPALHRRRAGPWRLPTR